MFFLNETDCVIPTKQQFSIWDLKNGTQKKLIKPNITGEIYSFSVSCSGKYIVVGGSKKGDVFLLDLESDKQTKYDLMIQIKEMGTDDYHGFRITEVSVSNSGNVAVLAGNPKKIIYIDNRTREFQFFHTISEVEKILFLADESLLAICENKNIVKFDRSGKEFMNVESKSLSIQLNKLHCFSIDARDSIISATFDNLMSSEGPMILILSESNLEVLSILKLSIQKACVIDRNRILGTSGTEIMILDVNTFEVTHSIKAEGYINIASSNSGDIIAASTFSQYNLVLDSNLNRIRIQCLPGSSECAALSEDDKYYAVVSVSGDIYILDAETGLIITQISTNNHIRADAMCFYSSGSKIFIVYSGIIVYDLVKREWSTIPFSGGADVLMSYREGRNLIAHKKNGLLCNIDLVNNYSKLYIGKTPYKQVLLSMNEFFALDTREDGGYLEIVKYDALNFEALWRTTIETIGGFLFYSKIDETLYLFSKERYYSLSSKNGLLKHSKEYPYFPISSVSKIERNGRYIISPQDKKDGLVIFDLKANEVCKNVSGLRGKRDYVCNIDTFKKSDNFVTTTVDGSIIFWSYKEKDSGIILKKSSIIDKEY